MNSGSHNQELVEKTESKSQPYYLPVDLINRLAALAEPEERSASYVLSKVLEKVIPVLENDKQVLCQFLEKTDSYKILIER